MIAWKIDSLYPRLLSWKLLHSKGSTLHQNLNTPWKGHTCCMFWDVSGMETKKSRSLWLIASWELDLQKLSTEYLGETKERVAPWESRKVAWRTEKCEGTKDKPSSLSHCSSFKRFVPGLKADSQGNCWVPLCWKTEEPRHLKWASSDLEIQPMTPPPLSPLTYTLWMALFQQGNYTSLP